MKSNAIKMSLLFCLTLALATSIYAQEKYPDRPIDFIIPWGVGGGGDTTARFLARIVEKDFGVALPVSNIPGASGTVGLAELFNAKADGYTIGFCSADNLAPLTMGTARFELTDLEWITRYQLITSFFFVKTDSPFKTIQDLLKYVKENPDKLSVSISGFGTSDDVTVRYLASKGYKMTSIPYPKRSEGYASTLGGHTDILYEQTGDIKQYLDAKQLRPLIIFSDKRDPRFPDIPCSVELGFDIQLPNFRCIVVKKGTPQDRINKLVDAFKKATDTLEWKEFDRGMMSDPNSYMGPDKFPKWVASELEGTKNLMKTLGMIK
jgi:tripartite-type tricarboxylate transporter receptor subunit TctC